MRFGISHLLLLMVNIALLCAFTRTFPIVLLVPPVLYGSIFSFHAARRFDSRIERTMLIGGLSTCLSAMTISFPFFVGELLCSKHFLLSSTEILCLILILAHPAIVLGVLIGVFWDIAHLFTTHSTYSKTDFRSDEIDADSIEY